MIKEKFTLVLFVILSFTFLSYTCFSQKVKRGDIKDAIEEGGIKEVAIVTKDTFWPQVESEMDIQLTFLDGTVVLASEHKIIWKKAIISSGNMTIDDNTGKFTPWEPYYYYPNIPINISVTIGGKKVSKELRPSFLYSNYSTSKRGDSGTNGTGGRLGSTGTAKTSPGSGSNGNPGGNGGNGPNLDIQIEEELIGEVPHVIVNINGKKYPIHYQTESITVKTIGGSGGSGGVGGIGGTGQKIGDKFQENGGSGGNGGGGGDGGDGGSIYVTGGALQKYKSILNFSSEGGSGGSGGNGGMGGNGIARGKVGTRGRDGRNGSSGVINYQQMPSGTPEYNQRVTVVEVPKSDPIQTKGDLLITSDMLVTLTLDGEFIGTADVGKNLKIKTEQGQRLLDIIPEVAKDKVISEVIEVKAQSQVIKQIKLRQIYGEAEDARKKGNN